MHTPLDNAIVCQISRPTFPERNSIELKAAIARVKQQKPAQRFFNQWSDMRLASYNLAAYLTGYWPDPQQRTENLLDACLDSAFRLTETLLENRCEPAEIKSAFIQSVIADLALSLQYPLMVRTRNSLQPHPLNGPLLGDLIRHGNVLSLTWANNPPPGQQGETAKIIVASRVFSLADLALVGAIG